MTREINPADAVVLVAGQPVQVCLEPAERFTLSPRQERPAGLLPLRVEGTDDRGRLVRVDAPAQVVAGDEPGAYLLRAYEDPDLPWPTRDVDLRLVPGSESDAALRRIAGGASA